MSVEFESLVTMADILESWEDLPDGYVVIGLECAELSLTMIAAISNTEEIGDFNYSEEEEEDLEKSEYVKNNNMKYLTDTHQIFLICSNVSDNKDNATPSDFLNALNHWLDFDTYIYK